MTRSILPLKYSHRRKQFSFIVSIIPLNSSKLLVMDGYLMGCSLNNAYARRLCMQYRKMVQELHKKIGHSDAIVLVKIIVKVYL